VTRDIIIIIINSDIVICLVLALNLSTVMPFFLSFFLSLFASYRSLQNDNGHVKKDITVKFSTWNLKDLTRIPL
jgi:hypothetical protein